MRWVFSLLLVSLLAGCLGTPGEAELDSVDAAGADGDGTAGADGNNTAPKVSLSYELDGFNATFLVDATDADGDVVSWSLDADGDGAEDATGNGTGNATFAYARAGNHTATVVATDGNATSEANVTVVVAPGGSEASEDGNETAGSSDGTDGTDGAGSTGSAHPGQTEEGTWLTGVMVVGCFGDIFGFGYPGQSDGVTHATFPVEAATWGYDYQVRVTASVADSPGVSFLGDDGGFLGGGFLSDAGTGTVPEGAVTGVFWVCAGADLSGSYTSTPP